MSKQQEVAEKLNAGGWLHFMPDNDLGWKFRFRQNDLPPHPYFGPWHDYITIFKSGRIQAGIIENRYQRDTRRRAEIVFRDFRDYPWGGQWK